MVLIQLIQRCCLGEREILKERGKRRGEERQRVETAGGENKERESKNERERERQIQYERNTMRLESECVFAPSAASASLRERFLMRGRIGPAGALFPLAFITLSSCLSHTAD